MNINLIQNYYDSKNSDRQAELSETLKNNINNTCIDKIHLFIEPDFELDE